ncbi:MAG: hypothetical protein HQK98_12210 [Nitrospirae bacterium]|nr:hypothetical protein [Nitrospirota bacterium]
MPLSKLQTEILHLLATHRNPESYVAGASALNQNSPRFSGDIDIFHDREEAVAQTSNEDTVLLAEHGFTFDWLRREPGIHTAVVHRGNESTKLEWVRDSDFRFFPTVKDELFGYRLHIADLATNKALAAAGRRQPQPDNLTGYVEHAGRRRGYWPSTSEIGSAMLYSDAKKPKP